MVKSYPRGPTSSLSPLLVRGYSSLGFARTHHVDQKARALVAICSQITMTTLWDTRLKGRKRKNVQLSKDVHDTNLFGPSEERRGLHLFDSDRFSKFRDLVYCETLESLVLVGRWRLGFV